MTKKFYGILVLLIMGSLSVFSQIQKQNAMQKFSVNVQPKQINDLRQRLANTRWIAEGKRPEWDTNLNVTTLKEIATYWNNTYNWKKQEAYINSFQQYTAKVSDINIHYIYEKGTGTKHIPVLFLHGWASNFTEFLEVAELLKKESPDIDIIIPSIPGFGFSDEPDTMSSEIAAKYLQHLMTEILGYTSYYVHGGDYGAWIAEKLALNYPQYVKGLHLFDIPFYHLYSANENLSDTENKFIEKVNEWSMMDGAYGMIQGTKPKVLATGLNDSPMALAAWLLQLFNDLGNKEEDLFARFSKDKLITNIAIYWFTEKTYSSMRIYSEDIGGFGGELNKKVSVPVAFNFHPFDIQGIPPKEFVSRFFTNISNWTEQQYGGHFAGFSHPRQLKDNLVSFIEKTEK